VFLLTKKAINAILANLYQNLIILGGNKVKKTPQQKFWCACRRIWLYSITLSVLCLIIPGLPSALFMVPFMAAIRLTFTTYCQIVATTEYKSPA